MSKFSDLTVRLSKSQNYCETFDLNFKLVPSPFLDKWIDRFLHAQQRQDPISEPWAFYNLNQDWNEERVVQFINEKIEYCNSRVPNMFTKQLSSVKDQDCLNYIHSVFELEHGQLDKWQTNPRVADASVRNALSHINQTVHRAESLGQNPRIRCVWFDLPKTERFTSQDYKLFTNKVDFGGVYTLYADVGKNVESLSRDNDNHHHDFVPNLHYSSDFLITFYDTDGVKQKQLYDNYVKDNTNYFTSLGYDANDVRLTTGRIKIAQLDYKTKDAILKSVSEYNNIQSVNIHGII